MFGRLAVAIACCALSASAFLIPPTVELKNDDTSSSALSFIPVDTKSNQFRLPCIECDWAYDGGFNSKTLNDLLINFTITEDGQSLLANGITVFPTALLPQSLDRLTDIFLDQIPTSTTQEEIQSGDFSRVPLRVGHAGVIENKALSTIEFDMIPLQLKIFVLEQKHVDLPTVAIQLLRSEDGELSLLSVDLLSRQDTINEMPDFSRLTEGPPDLPTYSSRPLDRPCSLPAPICAFGRFIGSTFGSGERHPCPGRKFKFDGEHLPTHIRPHIGRPMPVDDSELSADMRPPFGDDKPFHRPHHGHRHRHHRHGFFHGISRGILAFLIPVMAGITVGIVVSVLGLMFGRFIGYLCFTAFRGRRRGYNSVPAEEGHAGDVKEDTKTTFEQPLPPYEDAPAYEQVVQDSRPAA